MTMLLICQMCRDLGFLPIEVEHALKATNNDVRLATDALLQGKFATWRGDYTERTNGAGASAVSSSSAGSLSSSVSEGGAIAGVSVSNDGSAAPASWGDGRDGSEERTDASAEEALERLAPTMSTRDDEYLDFSLDIEEKFLSDYLNLLQQQRR
jgi:hypothetical protein